jgi:UTP--glucose-1-phosphate uridylyltransferase
LTDGIAALINEEQVLAYEFSGRRHDCGSKLGYLVATVEYGLRHPELGEQFRAYLQSYGCQFDGSAPTTSLLISSPSKEAGSTE